MTKPYIDYENGLKEALKNPIEASEYLNEVFKEWLAGRLPHGVEGCC